MKLFITGATGYIAGDVLHLVQENHPEYDVTCMVRTQQNADVIKKKYANVHIVLGDNNDAKVIEEQVHKADVILPNSADDMVSAHTIKQALLGKTTKTFYIHISGTGMLTYKSQPGEERGDKIYDDIDDLDELRNFPVDALHRNVEQVVVELAQAKPDLIKVAIVSPPAIYGRGRGPVNTAAMIIPFFSDLTLKIGHGIATKPATGWKTIHVHDLSALNLLLLEDAAAGGPRGDWGKEGYYFAQGPHVAWNDLLRKIAEEARRAGLLKSDETKEYDMPGMAQLGPIGPIAVTNSNSVGSRARRVFGWTPKEGSILDDVAREVKLAAEKSGL